MVLIAPAGGCPLCVLEPLNSPSTRAALGGNCKVAKGGESAIGADVIWAAAECELCELVLGLPRVPNVGDLGNGVSPGVGGREPLWRLSAASAASLKLLAFLLCNGARTGDRWGLAEAIPEV